MILRDVSLSKPGIYAIKVTAGKHSRDISWNVYDTGPRKAKNVILFIGDGLSPGASRGRAHPVEGCFGGARARQACDR